MKNGWHDHYCPECKTGFVCSKVTHCNDPFEKLCLEHTNVIPIKEKDFITSRTEEHYYKTGKWPGESS